MDGLQYLDHPTRRAAVQVVHIQHDAIDLRIKALGRFEDRATR